MPNLCVLSINVSDMDQATRFYCDILGFEISRVYDDQIISLKHEGVSLFCKNATVLRKPITRMKLRL